MAAVFVSFIFPQSAEDVWRILRDFKAISSWLPGIGPSEIENGLQTDQLGAIRAFDLLGPDAPVREKLVSLSDREHSLKYALRQGPLPLRNMTAEMRVHPITETGGALVCWGAVFDCAEANEATCKGQLQGLYAEGLMNLKKVLNSRAG